MSRTPVMILQELGAKRAVLPVYDLVEAKTGTHQNSFTMKVTYQNFMTEGTASSKKNAKQLAADAMLKLLEGNSGSNDSHGTSDSAKASSATVTANENSKDCSFDKQYANYIGMLQEYCQKYSLPNPCYTLVGESGPDNIKTFTIKGTFQSLEAVASATTKKQAKQNAAKGIFQQLVPDRDKTCKSLDLDLAAMGISLLKIDDSLKFEETTEYAKNYYKKCTQASNDIEEEDVSFENCHLHFKKKYKVNQRIIDDLNCLRNQIRINVSHVDSTIELISKEFDTLKKIDLPSTNRNVMLVGFELNTSPKIFEIGMGENMTEAQKEAIINMIDTLIALVN